MLCGVLTIYSKEIKMNQMEFVNFQAVQGQKYLGIATVNFNGVMLRYKIVSNKDGNGYFPAAASYNVGTEGADRYITAFCLDSNTQNEILKELIMERVGQYFANANRTQSAPPPINYPIQNGQAVNQPQNQNYSAPMPTYQSTPHDEQLPF